MVGMCAGLRVGVWCVYVCSVRVLVAEGLELVVGVCCCAGGIPT